MADTKEPMTEVQRARSLLLVVPHYAEEDVLPPPDPGPMSAEHAGIDPELAREQLHKLGGLATLRAHSDGLQDPAEITAAELVIREGLIAIAKTLYPNATAKI